MATANNSKRPVKSQDAISLELTIGTPAIRFLDKYCLILLLCSKKLFKCKHLFKLDYSFMVMPAAKAFEGYLRKLIERKGLNRSSKYDIGKIFSADTHNNPQHPVNKQLRDEKYKKIILKVSAEWDFCRHKIMHYDEKFRIKDYKEANRKFERILETIKDSYVAYVDESEPSTEAIKASKVVTPSLSDNDIKNYIEAFRPRYQQPRTKWPTIEEQFERVRKEIAKERILKEKSKK